MMRFRPAPLPTVFVFIGLFILANLGAWQLRRHAWSTARLDGIEKRLQAPPVGNRELDGSPDELAWHRAHLTGHFGEVRPALVTGRFEFGRPGYDVVLPFHVDDGPTLLVNRGWIPKEDLEERLQSIAPGGDTRDVHGLLLPLSGPPDAPPIPATGDLPVRWKDHHYAAIAQSMEIEVAPIYLTAGDRLAEGEAKQHAPLPISGYVPTPKSLPHWEYAMTWFLIFGTLFVTWIGTSLKRGARS